MAAPRRVIGAAAAAAHRADAAASRARTIVRDSRLVLRGAALTVGERLSPLRVLAEQGLASGVFAVLSALEQPAPLPRHASRRTARRRRARR